jgi:hypothetical protein
MSASSCLRPSTPRRKSRTEPCVLSFAVPRTMTGFPHGRGALHRQAKICHFVCHPGARGCTEFASDASVGICPHWNVHRRFRGKVPKWSKPPPERFRREVFHLGRQHPSAAGVAAAACILTGVVTRKAAHEFIKLVRLAMSSSASPLKNRRASSNSASVNATITLKVETPGARLLPLPSLPNGAPACGYTEAFFGELTAEQAVLHYNKAGIASNVWTKAHETKNEGLDTKVREHKDRLGCAAGSMDFRGGADRLLPFQSTVRFAPGRCAISPGVVSSGPNRIARP